MKPIISVENLGKRYRIKQDAGDSPTNFREVLTDLPRRLFKGGVRTRTEDFWALKDVSFDIMPGDRVGIIGRNGAGKSTLLKLLSRITEPTTGRITLRGRTASLLEVGTGFHAELTGRENIYLNGAILGMSRAEVAKKFDEIVDFAGVEKFLDTPVKRYSSGMYVRLGFAVAAHLEPEVLIVDEVLAVGDMEFQRKCIGKMKEVSDGEGRTVLLVSHQLHFVQTLCSRGLLLVGGQILADGLTHNVIDQYMAERSESVLQDSTLTRIGHSDLPFLRQISLATSDGSSVDNCTSCTELMLNCSISPGNIDENKKYQMIWFIMNSIDEIMASSASETMHSFSLDRTTTEICCTIKIDPLPIGNYYFRIALHVPGAENYDDVDAVLPFSITRHTYGSQTLGTSQDYNAKLFLQNEWK